MPVCPNEKTPQNTYFSAFFSMGMKKDLGGIASVKVKFFYAVKDGPTCLKQDEWACLATYGLFPLNHSNLKFFLVSSALFTILIFLFRILFRIFSVFFYFWKSYKFLLVLYIAVEKSSAILFNS